MNVATKIAAQPRVTYGPEHAELLAKLNNIEIKARLKASRDEAGLTQTELADGANVHWRSVQDYESPKTPTVPPMSVIVRWAELTNVSVSWLLHGQELPPGAEERLARIEQMVETMFEMLPEVLRRLPPAEEPPKESQGG